MSAVTQASAGSALPAAYRLDDYVIDRVLGHGGFGITYLARDTKLNARVAIKEYFPRALAARDASFTITPITGGSTTGADYRWGLQEFLKEARALARFKHNHIVRVLRFLETNGTAYMVMEYEQGESLADALKRSGGFLNEAKLMQIFLPILSGLQAVHDAGLLHLDIKPDNIYLRRDGEPMLIDFGSVRQVKSGSSRTDKVALTPAYSAIEQYPGLGDKGPWTDVYSLGATLYRCVTGKPPVDSLARYQAKQQHRVDPYISATEFERPFFSRHIRECIDLALELDPEDRPHSAQQLQKGLMGQRITEEGSRKIIRPSGNLNYEAIPQHHLDIQPRRKRRTRGRLESLFFTTVLSVAVAVFTLQLMVRFGILSQDDVFTRFGHLRDESVRVSRAKVVQLDKMLYDKWRIHLLPQKQAVQTATAAPAPAATQKKKRLPFSTDRSVVKVLAGHHGAIESIRFLGASTLAALDERGEVRIWDTSSGKTLKRFRNSGTGPVVMAASADGHWLARSQGDKVMLWDVSAARSGPELDGFASAPSAMEFTPDGARLAVIEDKKSISLWTLADHKLVYRIDQQDDEKPHDITAVSFSPNGLLFATANDDGKVTIWSVGNGAELSEITARKPGNKVNGLQYSTDGAWLATSGPDGFLKLYDSDADPHDKLLRDPPADVETIAFSNDRRWVLTGGDGKTIQLWNIDKAKLAKEWTAGDKQVNALAISPDDQWVASGGADGKIRIWN